MLTEIADKGEVIGKPRFFQHTPGITTHRKYPACIDGVMFVQYQLMGLVSNRPLINHRLTVILTGAFQTIQFE